MATTAAQGPARVPTPRPKAVPPASSAISEPIATSGSRPSQQQSSGAKGGGDGAGARRGIRAVTADPLSDRATVFLIRRTLCPQHLDKGKGTVPPIEDILPPLTSRNDVDLQLYALISIILREFVQNWYSKITPDEIFVAEIVQIIAHITRTLEQRLRKVKLESLLFDELPDLLDKHITAYRTAHDPAIHHPLKTNPREIYHALCPLPALSPVPRADDPATAAGQAKNEASYRQLLVQGILAVLLPTEDLENDCLTALVGQIFSELIIANAVSNKLSEPWLIYEVLIIASRVILQKRATGNERVLGGLSNKGSPPKPNRMFSLNALFWTILQWCFVATSFLRTTFTILLASRSVPFRASHGKGSRGNVTDQKTRFEPMQSAILSETEPQPVKTPVLAFRLWTAVSNLIEMDVRMPWLHGTLSLLQWIAMTGPGRMADVDGRLDRLLSYGIHRYLLEPAVLPPLLRNVRGALFPNNMPGTPTLMAPSSDAELLALRRRCAKALWALVPKNGPVGRAAGKLYFNGHFSSSPPPSFGRTDPSQRGRAGREDGRIRGAQRSSTSAPTSAASPQAVTAGSAQVHQHRHGSAAALSLSSTETRAAPQKGVRTAPSSGGGGQSSPLAPPVDNGAADALAAQNSRPSTNDVGHTDTADRGQPLCQEEQEDDDEAILEEIERGILDVFGDAYSNKHLVYGIVELILVRILPELAEKGATELWAERLSS